MHLPGMTAVEVIYTSSGQFPNKDGYCESTFVCPLEETKEWLVEKEKRISRMKVWKVGFICRQGF